MPEWIFDDTAEIGEARIFVAHTTPPRFFGEVVSEDEAGIGGVQICVCERQIINVTDWIDAPDFDADALCQSFAEAWSRHWSVRGG